MSDAFTDLRHALRKRHDRLKKESSRCEDRAQVELLKAQKKEVWHIWNTFLFEGSEQQKGQSK